MRTPRLVAGLAATLPWAVQPIEAPEDFPDLLTGSFTDGRKFSTGNTLPLIARPWGFNHWSVQTNNGQTSWWFGGADHEFHWIRLTHQPSPWIGDWAYLNFGPQMGGRVDEPVMFFEPWGAKIKPYTFDATLGPDNMRVQLTPSDHGAVLKVTFPEVNPRNYEKRVCFKLPPWNKKQSPGSFGAQDAQNMWLELITSRAEQVPANFGLHVRAEVDIATLQHSQDVRQKISTGPGVQCFEFSPRETSVTVWVGTSLISAEQARLNLDREVKGRRFEDVEDECRLVWRNLLSRVDVADPGPNSEQSFKRVGLFYTGLYRALLFPRRLDEIDASGKRVHYSPYDQSGRTFDGILVTDTGFWDTFRTVYPLLTLVYPLELGEIVTGWLNAYKEGSWLPEWSSPGYRSCMVGTYADVVVADAILKGIPGVDGELAWQALARDAFVPGGGRGQGGKSNYNDYDSLGYIPADRNPDSVSGTLDFAFSDFAVSLIAEKQGRSSDAQRLRKRALGAREHLFDRGLGLMRPKMRSGQLKQGDPSMWGDGYVEGSAWHHSFPAFDLPGLAALHGSHRRLAEKIRELLTTPGTFLPGTYRTTIHEMEEMRALGLGQYGHSNQPVHHILWLLIMLDEATPECNASASAPVSSAAFCPRRIAEDFIGKVLRKAYGIGFYAGDEDNGEMGAWYVLTALGLFESAPGTHQGYTLGSPLFRRVDIRRQPLGGSTTGDQAPSLTILSPSAGTEEVVHVSRVLLNDQDIGTGAGQTGGLRWALPYETLALSMPGATLRYIASPSDATAPVAPPQALGGALAPQAAGAVGAASSAAATGLAPNERLNLQHRIRALERQLEVQTARADRASRSQDSPPAASQPVAAQAASASSGDALVQEAQRMQIRDLERQLEEARKWQQQRAGVRPSAATPEPEVSSGLVTTVEMAFLILVAVNAIGWFLCIFYRPRSNGKVASSEGSSRRSKRSHVANGRRRGDQMV